MMGKASSRGKGSAKGKTTDIHEDKPAASNDASTGGCSGNVLDTLKHYVNQAETVDEAARLLAMAQSLSTPTPTSATQFLDKRPVSPQRAVAPKPTTRAARAELRPSSRSTSAVAKPSSRLDRLHPRTGVWAAPEPPPRIPRAPRIPPMRLARRPDMMYVASAPLPKPSSKARPARSTSMGEVGPHPAPPPRRSHSAPPTDTSSEEDSWGAWTGKEIVSTEKEVDCRCSLCEEIRALGRQPPT